MFLQEKKIQRVFLFLVLAFPEAICLDFEIGDVLNFLYGVNICLTKITERDLNATSRK